jgi:CheY-like chemotaxis protein
MSPDKQQGFKILIVDDEPVITDTLSMILRQNGYDCMKAYDGESALEMALQTPPDLLLTDVVLPGMNGIQLAITVRGRIPKCKTLLLSGQAGTLQLLRDASVQGHDFEILTKPVHPSDLLKHIEYLLAES